MDDNEILMIVLAFILGYMASGMMKSMCGGRLVEGNASPAPTTPAPTTTPGPTTAPEQTTPGPTTPGPTPPQTKINELASPATMTTDIQGKACEACTCRMNANKNGPEWCCVTNCLDRQLFDDKFCSNPNKDEPDRDVNLDKYLRNLPNEDINNLLLLYS